MTKKLHLHSNSQEMKRHLLSLTLLLLLSTIGFTQCFKAIPNNANVVSTIQTVNGGFTPQWICPGDTLYSGGGIMFIFVEPGAVFNTGGGIDTIFVRSGGTLIMNGGIHEIYFEPGAILNVSGGIPYYDTCLAVTFDYTNAPPNGCITGLASQNKNETQVSVFPNPSKGNFTVSVGEKKNAMVEIYNVLNEIIYSSEIFHSKAEIELHAKSGIYFYRVMDGEKMIAEGKLIIE